MLFTLSDIQSQLGQVSFDEGLHRGWEIAPTVLRGGELVTAIIQAGAKRLRVYIKVRRNQIAVEIAGECTCPERKNCVHVAAVLLKVLADEGEGLDGAGPVAKNRPERDDLTASTTNLQLLYVLCDAGNNITLETFTARPEKNGGFSAVKFYDPSWALRGSAPSRFLTPTDIELLSSLARLERNQTTNLPCLIGAEGSRLLTRLVDIGRVYYKNLDSKALSLGEPRPLRFKWLMDEQGVQHLMVEVEPMAAAQVALQPPWYFDALINEAGLVKTAITLEHLTALSNLPPVGPTKINDRQIELNRRFPQVALPPLQRLSIERRTLIQPIPCLTFSSMMNEASADRQAEKFDVVRINFDYEGLRFGRSSPPQCLFEERLVQIQRDDAFEEACIERLLLLGFDEITQWRCSGDDCFSLSRDSNNWLNFQFYDLPRLSESGWRIEFDACFSCQITHAERWHGEIGPGDDEEWFNVSLGLEVAGERINLLPLLVNVFREFPGVFTHQQMQGVDDKKLFSFPLEDGRLLALPFGRLRHILDILFELYDPLALDDEPRLRFNRFQVARLAELEDEGICWSGLGADALRQLAERLRGVDEIVAVLPPQGLQAALRPYQQRGLDWLQFLREYNLAGILADDMGLGKTVQTLAHLLVEKEQGRMDRPCLVVAPTSLMVNWRKEAARFAPTLKVLTLQGPQRQVHFNDIANYDLVLTTYALLPRDERTLLSHDYHVLILDEAQLIKNPKAQASLVVRRIAARHRLCLTGTPMENHLGELWALFDFLLPGFLGGQKQFRRLFRIPIEKQGDVSKAQCLARRVRPFMLRRTKQAVVADLPAKTEIISGVVLEGVQRELYETIRLALHRRVQDEIERKGIAGSQIVILDALLKLRQVCCDPRLVKLESARKVKVSAKFNLLMALLPEMVEEGRRVLLFSQFTGMLKLIEAELLAVGIDYVKLTGQTRDRATPVERFQNREVPLFLISLKAGGVGLNLTAADTVIHYDPWWNPAVERQATDRAHRIGQDNPVFVYKLISEGTVEERIQVMQQRKQALAETLYGDKATIEPRWTEQDLEQLFAPLSDQ